MKKAGIAVGAILILLAVGVYWIATHNSKDDNEEPKTSQTQGQMNGVTNKKDVTSTTTTTTKKVVKQEEPEQTAQTQTEDITTPSDSTSKKVKQSTQATQTTQTTQSNPSTIDNGNISATKQGGTTFSDISKDSLGEPITTKTEIMVVSDKRIQLMDGNYGTTKDKQLVYIADLLGGNETYHLYLNGSAYKSVDVGDKLKVKYSVYQNSTGVEFPVIMNVTTAED